MIRSSSYGYARYGFRGSQSWANARFGDQAADNVTAAQTVLSELRRAYTIGLTKINFNPDAIAQIVTGVPIASLVGSNASVDAAGANFRKDATYIDQLAGDLLSYAKAGQRPDGSTYAWTSWSGFAKDVANDMAAQVGVAWDSSFVLSTLASIKDTAIATAQTVGNAAKKAEEVATSPFTWLGVGAVAIVAGIVILRMK